MATHSSILAWRIPWTEEPGGLQSMESQRVRHALATDTFTNTIRKSFPYTLRKNKAKRNLAPSRLPYFPMSQVLTYTVVPTVFLFYFSINKMSYHQQARENFWWQSFQLGAAEGKKRAPPTHRLLAPKCHSSSLMQPTPPCHSSSASQLKRDETDKYLSNTEKHPEGV